MMPTRDPALADAGQAVGVPDSLSVMKFGGSSFATRAQIAGVCEYIRTRLADQGPQHRIICVVSAPSGLTEQYRDTLLALNPTPSDRLIDAGLPLADSVGSVMVAGALQALGVGATVAHGSQIGLRTDRNYTRAQLQDTVRAPLAALLARHQVVVVPGGQAAAADTGETTWMGKNSSDLSAIALAAAFGCDTVEIHSDVPGVYSCDPNMVPEAYPIPRLSHGQAVNMSIAGAKVLHHRGVQFALNNGVRIVCRGNSGDFATGTILSGDGTIAAAVVPDARSQVFGGDGQQIANAADALERASVPFVLVRLADGTARLVVTCGFFDAPHFMAQRHIVLELLALRLVSVITADGAILRELVTPAELAARTQALHRIYCRAAGGMPAASTTADATAATATAGAALSRQLAVLPELGAAHV
jgi:aspartate kinase